MTMATAPGTEIHEKLSDVTECSICAEIFTNPKLLPCVHTFCLHCLEEYGKHKYPGDHMACPLCRNEFIIPQEGFSKLPNNFFIAKVVEIGKLAIVPTKQEVCELCFEETSVSKMFCIDCEQKLCDRCSKSHTRIKNFKKHQLAELGSQLKVQELKLRNSYCEHHREELIKMYCHEDNVAICLICFAESHQSHRCSNVDKASGIFAEQLQDESRKVSTWSPKCVDAVQKLENLKTEFEEEVLNTEGSIRNSCAKFKELIDQHTEILVQSLKIVRDTNLKIFEVAKQDVDSLKVMIDSFQRYCDELLSRGSPVDICRDANQMHTRATDLDKQAVKCILDDVDYDLISFHSANLENAVQQFGSNNIVGELRVTKSADWFVTSPKNISAFRPCDAAGLVEGFLPMDFGVIDVITKYMKDELQKIKAELRESSGSLDTSKGESGFIVKGYESGAVKAKTDLLKLAENVLVYDHDIDRPGIPAYFYSRSGNDVLRGIQISQKVSIQLDRTQSRSEPQALAGCGIEICPVEVRPGKCMAIMTGDIIKCRVDAIVNSADGDLKRRTGVYATIAKAAGPELEDDCMARTKFKGPLLPGEAYVTRAGKLPCKKVIHAVGLGCNGGFSNVERILAMAVDSSLNAADKEGLMSIAFPLINTGIVGLSLDRRTDIIVETVKSYFENNSTTAVSRVLIVANDPLDIANLESKLRTIHVESLSELQRNKGGRIVIGERKDLRTSQKQPQVIILQSANQARATQRTRTIAGGRQWYERQCEDRQPQHLNRITLSIYAPSLGAINDAREEIEQEIVYFIAGKSLR